MNLKQYKEVLLVGFVIATVLFASCGDHRNEVVLWPHNAVRKRAQDYAVNSSSQLEALRHANPEQDAARAAKVGDLRLIGSRPNFPNFFGVPEDGTASVLVARDGFKVIGVTEELLSNQEFIALKREYEERYNKWMSEYAMKAKDPVQKGKTLGSDLDGG